MKWYQKFLMYWGGLMLLIQVSYIAIAILYILSR